MESIIHLAETESTNNYLIALLKKEQLDEGTIVIADYQKAGKGQGGNSWESEPGKNITCSIVLYPFFIEARSQFIISQLVSLSVIKTLERIIPNTSIKWPNDIYVGDKKIGGILIENILNGKCIDKCIIGIGLNVNQTLFTSNAPNPISLKQITGKEVDLMELLQQIRQQILLNYTEVLKGNNATIMNQYMNCLYRKSGFYPYKTQTECFEARIKTILPSGEMALEKKDKRVQTYGFKEVEFVIP